MKKTDNRKNPWAGLSSYEDPLKSKHRLKFCGRDRETKDVTRLIDDNFFVTLYGKSGIGKTSLLNAGVFPALRREQYMPLSLRLGMADDKLAFQSIITQAIEHTIAEAGGDIQIINVIDQHDNIKATDYLWRWFACRRFTAANGQIVFPVLVFDQFEEVFRRPESRKKTEILLSQLNYLIDDSHALNDMVVEGEDYSYDFNFRFVLSIREDDLYRLEDSLDNCSLPALKRCRYRLRSLKEQDAESVILIPGEGLFKEEEKKQIADAVISKSRNEDGSISTNIVSLLCSLIYEEFIKSGADHVTPALVDTFIKGNPFEQFYNEATQGLSNREKSYIEEKLVDSSGRRDSISEGDFLSHVKNDDKRKKLLKGKYRILQHTSTSSDGQSYRIELIHDSFCDVLIGLKNKREKTKRIKQMGFAGLIAIIGIGIVSGFLFLSENAKQEKKLKDIALEKAKLNEVVAAKERKAKELALLNESRTRETNEILILKNDSIVSLKTILESKNDSLQQQIFINLQKDKTIERLKSYEHKIIDNNIAGRLYDRISDDLKPYITKMTVSGEINGSDIRLIQQMIYEGSLIHLDLENARIVEGRGSYFDYNVSKYRELTFPNVIGEGMFACLTRLKTIKLPNSVRSIEQSAFSGCKELTTVTIPDKVTSIGGFVFYGCTSLTSVNIPDKVTSIGTHAFSRCTSLTSVNIPNSVISIDTYAFENCKKLTTVTLPNKVTSIKENTFYKCSGLTSVAIPSSVTSIDHDAFFGCTGLTSVDIPNSVTKIGYRAFGSCTSLTSVTLPNSLTSIDSGTFSYCSNLASVYIPNTVTSIANEVFLGCRGLTVVNIPNTVTNIGYKAFSGCFGLTSVTIPNSVDSIDQGTFEECISLISINIPNSVKSIGNKAFFKCSDLTHVTIPNSVTSIGEEAFYGCLDLTSVIIPNSVKDIGHNAFSGFSQLLRKTDRFLCILCKTKDLENLKVDDDAFGSRDVSWVVPAGPANDKDFYVRKYQAQPWWNKEWKIKHE